MSERWGLRDPAKGTLVPMELTSAGKAFSEQWLISPVQNTSASWNSGDRRPRKESSAEVERKLMSAPKQRYLPSPGPGHVDFYA
jgi:hypothetical protein